MHGMVVCCGRIGVSVMKLVGLRVCVCSRRFLNRHKQDILK
jgi:hypothetical protein